MSRRQWSAEGRERRKRKKDEEEGRRKKEELELGGEQGETQKKDDSWRAGERARGSGECDGAGVRK